MNRLAVIALGSNLGDSCRTVLAAMDSVRARASAGWKRSSLYESSPVDCPPGSPRFINAIVAFVPLAGETPESLLDWILDLERSQGRRPKRVINEARLLDLDLIAFRDVTVATERLVLPHPRAHLRRFVLEPLTEILPAFVLPGFTDSVSGMLRALPVHETVIRLSDS